MTQPEAAPPSVLVLHGGALGDFVLTLHAAAAMARAIGTTSHPASIDLIARCELAGLAVEQGLLASAKSPEAAGLHHLFSQGPVPAELAVMFQRSHTIVSFLAGPGEPVSRRIRQHTAARVVCIDPTPDPEPVGIHIVHQWANQAKAQELVFEPASTALFPFTEQHRQAARRAVRQMLRREDNHRLDQAGTGAPWLICHPGSGSRNKNCPLESLDFVMTKLVASGQVALWMIGPTEWEWYGPAFAARLGRVAPVLYCEQISHAAGLLPAANLYIGNDAGMTHVAAALGLPTIALFGPTSPGIWRPLGPSVCVVRFDAAAPAETIAETIWQAATAQMADTRLTNVQTAARSTSSAGRSTQILKERSP